MSTLAWVLIGVVGAILVLIVGGLWRRSKQTAHAEKVGAAE